LNLKPGTGRHGQRWNFLEGCPGKIDAQFTAVLDAVAAVLGRRQML